MALVHDGAVTVVAGTRLRPASAPSPLLGRPASAPHQPHGPRKKLAPNSTTATTTT